MRIFLTGATGFVGRALLAAFRAGGHDVVALVRTPAKAEAVAAAGASAVVGDLGAPESYLAAARACAALVHAAFEYGADGSEHRDVDERAALALVGAARESGGAFVYTSNAYLLRTAGGEPVDEDVDAARLAGAAGAWRPALEQRILAASPSAAVVRLGFVYGGKGGTLPDLFAAARRSGRLGTVGSGRARASLVYHHDVAALYRMVIERGASGIFHATDGRPLAAIDFLRLVCRAAGVSDEVGPLEGGERLGLDEHTLDILDRDVAVLPRRSLALGWSPRFADFGAGAAAAYAEWLAGSVP